MGQVLPESVADVDRGGAGADFCQPAPRIEPRNRRKVAPDQVAARGAARTEMAG
jgi:hypothetical protein